MKKHMQTSIRESKRTDVILAIEATGGTLPPIETLATLTLGQLQALLRQAQQKRATSC